MSTNQLARPALRELAGGLPRAVALVITMGRDGPHLVTISTLSIVSFDPPLLALAIAQGSRTVQRLERSQRFTANLLDERQAALARRFARRGRPSGWLASGGVELIQREPSPPILAAADAWFDCRVERIVPTGDHRLFIGRVIESGGCGGSRPLISYRGALTSIGTSVALARGWQANHLDQLAIW